MSAADVAMRDLLAAQEQLAEAEGSTPEQIAEAKERRDVAIEMALEVGVPMQAVSEATGVSVTEIGRVFEEGSE